MPRYKHRRPRPRWRRLLFPLLCGLGLVLLAVGFVYNTRIAITNARFGPPGAEHPWDWAAEGCLGLACVLLAVLALTRPSPRRWRKGVPRNRASRPARARRRLRVQ